MNNLPELPPRFQNAFEAAKARAELKKATRTEQFPHAPHLADAPIQRAVLIQSVFFAFCTSARDACRAGDWTAAQVSRAVETAWPAICDSYVVLEHGECSEERKSEYRVALRRAVTDDRRWKGHLSDLETMAEGACATAAAPPEPRRVGKKREISERRDFLEGLAEDDLNYETSKRFYLEAWADSYGLVADALSGQASLSDIVEGCVRSFEQGARAHVAIKDATSIPARCRELDGMVKKSIRLVSDALAPESRRLGKANTAAAIAEFSRRVNEIVARSKQRILQSELARSADSTDTGESMNLTPEQRDLLFAIVDAHLSGDGGPFIFVQSHTSRGLIYATGRSISVSAVEVDFHQLAQESLITIVRVPGPGLSGKPTQRGIDTVASLKNKVAPSGEPVQLLASSRLEEQKPDVTTSIKEAHLSERDRGIHDRLGERSFRNLTNTEIARDKNLKKVLLEVQLKPGTDATKACLDRIRRAKGYPLSRTITNTRSTQK